MFNLENVQQQIMSGIEVFLMTLDSCHVINVCSTENCQ